MERSTYGIPSLVPKSSLNPRAKRHSNYGPLEKYSSHVSGQISTSDVSPERRRLKEQADEERRVLDLINKVQMFQIACDKVNY